MMIYGLPTGPWTMGHWDRGRVPCTLGRKSTTRAPTLEHTPSPHALCYQDTDTHKYKHTHPYVHRQGRGLGRMYVPLYCGTPEGRYLEAQQQRQQHQQQTQQTHTHTDTQRTRTHHIDKPCRIMARVATPTAAGSSAAGQLRQACRWAGIVSTRRRCGVKADRDVAPMELRVRLRQTGWLCSELRAQGHRAPREGA